ncbi:adenylate kinase [Actinotalea sp. M2MS4P-6]|uniref:adenylate kinase n=1 Tax=Actinotalea sp. M2MS4P-6 TaxID=2983762 RepID=UPI0021E478DC|nr:adenylate kinase [Actinotalea sp. M2MS4P-6]MCV2395547.1 adenylate kinase [Actinotalea sp. M2MS4P-6]
MSLRLVIMGPQGSGKGTQAALLAERLGVVTISTGDIFRSHMAAGDELGTLAQSYTSRGELVPDEVTNAMVRQRLAEPDVAEGFILDGYPRNCTQVDELDDILASLGTRLDGVIELTADRGELLARMARRAAIEQREDDTEDAIARRLDIYAEQTAPLTASYAARGLLVTVEGTGEIAEVAERIATAVAGVRS